MLRSPIFGWKAPATLNPDETSVTYLSYSGDALSGGMIGVDLPKYLPKTISKHSDLSLLAFPLSSEPIPVPLGGIAGSGAPGDRPSLPTIGFIVPVGDKAQAPLPALVVSPRSLSVAAAIFSKDTGPLGPSCADSWDNGNFLSPIRSDADQNSVLFITSQGSVKQMDISIGAFGRGMPFPPQVDFGNNSLRVMSMSNKGGLPSTLCLLLFEATGNDSGDAAGIAFKARDGFPKQIAWNPVDQHARRMPVLASDCDKFVYLGMPTPQPEKESVHPILYAGDFLGSPSQKVIVDASVVRGTGPQAVTITRGCRFAILHIPEGPESRDKIFLVNFGQDGGLGDETQFEIPDPLKGFLVPTFPLLSPAIAGAPLADPNRVRVAWFLERGLAVVDLQERSKDATQLLPEGQVFLTGFLSSQGNSRLTMSKDGNYLLASLQRGFTGVPEFRVFDLRVHERQALLDTLTGEQLRDVACRVVKFLPSSDGVGLQSSQSSNPPAQQPSATPGYADEVTSPQRICAQS